MTWWAWLWIVVLLVFAVSASWDDFAEQVAPWKIILDATVAAFTVGCVILGVDGTPSRGLRAALACAVALAAVWTIARCIEEYRQVSADGEIASTTDRVMAGITTAVVAGLYMPAWWMAWRATA